MNEPSMTESPEPVEPGVSAPEEPTTPAEVPLNAAPGTMHDSSVDVSAGGSVDAAPVTDAPDGLASDSERPETSPPDEIPAQDTLPEAVDVAGAPDESLSESGPADNSETPAVDSDTVALEAAPALDAAISLPVPDMVDADGIFANEPMAEVPPGIVPTDESPSERLPGEDTTSTAESQAVVPPAGPGVEPPAETADAPPVETVAPTPAPTRPPVPPVFFVWHPILNEERDDTEVLPSERLREAYHLLEVTGALHWREVKTHMPDVNLGKPDALTGFHTKAYCQSIVALSEGRASLWAQEDEVYLPSLLQTAPPAGLSVAAARSAVKLALKHPKVRVFTPAGQQPNACRDHFEEGHLYNDVVLALNDALSAGVKTAFINLDAEYPRQIRDRFRTEPLLTISLHEHPSFLYPHSAVVRDTGAGAGAGHHVNVPMPPAVSDAGYQLVLEKLILPLLQRYQPDLLVVLGGVTAHMSDPSSHLQLTSKGYQHLIATLMDVTPRLVLFGGDATHYATAARLWAIALATLAERTNSLPPQIPAAHARLWAGGTFHDTERPPRSAPYQEYTYALLSHELEQTYNLLRHQWDLPALTLPAQLSDQRERIQVRPSGDIVSFTSREPALGMTFAGLSQSLGDDDDDETASRRNPRSVSRSRTRWDEDTEEDETTPERGSARGRHNDPPAANPLAGSDRRTGSRPPSNREGGTAPGRPSRESDRRASDTGRGAPNEPRGSRGSERRTSDTGRGAPPEDRDIRGGDRRSPEGGRRALVEDRGSRSGGRHTSDPGTGRPGAQERPASSSTRDAVQQRPGAENRRRGEKGRHERGQPGQGEGREDRSPRSADGETRDGSRSPRHPHPAVLPRASTTTDKGTEAHSLTPSRSTPRSEDRDSGQPHPPPFRRREQGGRGKGDSTASATPPADGAAQTPDSRPARRHRPRPRR